MSPESSGGIDMTRANGLLLGLGIAIASAAGCSGGPPTEKDALLACQDRARSEMEDVAGNPRFRIHKAVIEQTESGPELYEFAIYGEYFYKTHYSGDHEMRFDCTVSQKPGTDQWVMEEFDYVCVGCG
jgi:hypothetical protein